MKVLTDELQFNDIPLFEGNKGFSVIYLEGEFHLFFTYNSLLNGVVCHYTSTDGYVWEEKDLSLRLRKKLDSVTAYTQLGKVYLYYAVKNPIGLTDIYLAISKDGDSFLPLPNAIIKNTALKDIKIIYSDGLRYLIGSEAKGAVIPAYSSFDGMEWHKSAVQNSAESAEIIDYLGAPSPFVAYNRTYLAYSMCGAKVAEAEIDFKNDGSVSIGKTVLETYGEVIRSVMIREATPILFIGCGKGIVPVEVYPTESGVGFRLYRDMLKRAKLRVDNGVEENAEMPTKLVREKGVMHVLDIPFKAGTSIDVDGATFEIGENNVIIIDGVTEIYPETDEKLNVSLLDMGNLVIFEACGGVYPVPTGESATINLNFTDYSYTSYKL